MITLIGHFPELISHPEATDIQCNCLNFFVFNLLPLYPLDGFRIWDALDRRRSKPFLFVRQYGYYILLGLILESYLCRLLGQVLPVLEYFDILGYYLEFVINGIFRLFGMFWGLFI